MEAKELYNENVGLTASILSVIKLIIVDRKHGDNITLEKGQMIYKESLFSKDKSSCLLNKSLSELFIISFGKFHLSSNSSLILDLFNLRRVDS